MLRRRRWVVLAMAIAGTLLMSSCLSIRYVRGTDWTLNDGQEGTIIMDLYLTHNHPSGSAYAFALMGRNTDLIDSGRKWDATNNYGGREVGNRNDAVRDLLLTTTGSLCNIGGLEPSDLEDAYDRWVAYVTTFQINLDSMLPDEPLQFRKSYTRDGDVGGFNGDGMGSFIIFTGLWDDSIGTESGVPEVTELMCGSQFAGNFYFND